VNQVLCPAPPVTQPKIDPPSAAELSRFCERLKSHPDFRDTVVCHRRLPPAPAVYAQDLKFSPFVSEALAHFGITRLFSHQADAVSYLRTGGNVMVATPTASGKTLIYNIAVIEALEKNPEARALYLFPLKALEQDQLKSLRRWLSGVKGVKASAEIYDGDTPPHLRSKIRSTVPEILFTNPDMLHRGILAHHEAWETLFRNLTYVILDEAHTYRGIFGSHVSQVIRRLKRICLRYGCRPRFILLSATVSNPERFAELLVEEPVNVVDRTGAPTAGRDFLFLNPVAGSNFSAARLFTECLRNGFRTIGFTQSRKVTELMHLWTSQLAPELQSRVSSYRAGFLPEERRLIEGRLARGDLLGVVSTSALEMGIDIGCLDICLLVGYPGTIITTWQRGGRVGRAGRDSMVILVGKPDALDQYFMKHPDQLFGRSFEAAVLDPNNSHVVREHLPCAASEFPLTLDDGSLWPDDFDVRLGELEKEGMLHRSAVDPPTWFTALRRPHLHVNIRAGGETFTIFERGTGQAIGTVSGMRALKECHEGAVYLHRGRQYLVESLSLRTRDIIVRRFPERYFTRALSEKETEIIRITRSRPVGQFVVREGELKVTERITAYEKRALPGQELLGVYDLDLPPHTFETVGFWIEIEPAIKDFIERGGLHFMGGIHAVEHAAIGMFPLFALCDRNDIGGISYPHHPQIGKGAVFIYDGYAGGVGLAERGFEVVEELLTKTLELIEGCECEDGCPSCIHSPKCGNGNKPLDKQAAIVVLRGLLGKIPLSEMMTVVDDSDEMQPQTPFEPVEPAHEKSPRILYFDLETRNLAAEVGGWKNCHLMRVSVVSVYDSRKKEFLVFTEERLDEFFGLLAEADLVVGFNIKRFDLPVLQPYTTMALDRLPAFDILEDIHRRLGFRLSLEHLAQQTLGRGKSADGVQAVAWFRSGEMEKLAEYCRRDVEVTRDLFLYGVEHGHLVYQRKDVDVPVRLPVDWGIEKILLNTVPEKVSEPNGPNLVAGRRK
jgi:DEAD/DEAH box helicase domain-containing protein